MAFEGVSSKPKVDQYALGLIGKLRTGVAAAFGTVARISSLLVALRRTTVPQWSAGLRQAPTVNRTLWTHRRRDSAPSGRDSAPSGRDTAPSGCTPSAGRLLGIILLKSNFGTSAHAARKIIIKLAASEPPPKARHACSLHVHGPAYGVASTDVQRDVPRAAGRVHRGAGGMLWSGVCGRHATGHARRARTMGLQCAALWSEVCTAGTAYGMGGAGGCERRGERVLAAGHGVYGGGVRGGVPSAWRRGVRALAAGFRHYVPRALSAACAAAGVSGGQGLAAGRCVRGVPRARYGRRRRRALSVQAGAQRGGHKAASVAGQGVRGGVPRQWRVQRVWRGAARVACVAVRGGECEQCGGRSRQALRAWRGRACMAEPRAWCAVCEVAGTRSRTRACRTLRAWRGSGGAWWCHVCGVRRARWALAAKACVAGCRVGQSRAGGLLCAARREVQGAVRGGMRSGRHVRVMQRGGLECARREMRCGVQRGGRWLEVWGAQKQADGGEGVCAMRGGVLCAWQNGVPSCAVGVRGGNAWQQTNARSAWRGEDRQNKRPALNGRLAHPNLANILVSKLQKFRYNPDSANDEREREAMRARRGMHVHASMHGGGRIRWVRVQYTAAAGRAAGHAYDDQGLQTSHMYGGGGVHVYDAQQGKRCGGALAFGVWRGVRWVAQVAAQREPRRAYVPCKCMPAGHAYDGRRVRRRLAAQRTPRRTGVAHAYSERRGACDARGVRGGRAQAYSVCGAHIWGGDKPDGPHALTCAPRCACDVQGRACMRGGQAQVYGVQRGERRLSAQHTWPADVRSGGAYAYSVRQSERRLAVQRKLYSANVQHAPRLRQFLSLCGVRLFKIACASAAWLVRWRGRGEQQITHWCRGEKTSAGTTAIAVILAIVEAARVGVRPEGAESRRRNATSKLEMHAAVPKAARAATHCTIVSRRVHGTTSKREMRAVVPKAGAPPVRASRLGLAGIGQPSFCLGALRRPFLLNV
ncbi:hypothetical protein GGX14DRAFT_389044 [Mycena pura]|uniref:Uncharacterized protein n=1 Tax=Mycena pura TaxID=153505 RepID=A0AAD6YIX6_9AGAR|nr:hypothetical protein GGX14DRAFT_389044 [Mycena pura]